LKDSRGQYIQPPLILLSGDKNMHYSDRMFDFCERKTIGYVSSRAIFVAGQRAQKNSLHGTAI